MTLSPTQGRAPEARRRAWPRHVARVAASFVVGSVLLAGAPRAHAHARLTRSVPQNQAVLATPPAAIELWFNELLDDEFNSVEVFRAEGGKPLDENDLVAAPPRVSDADRTHLEAPLRELAPGAYVVQWKVLSRDGHSARGRIQFRVGAGARPPEAP